MTEKERRALEFLAKAPSPRLSADQIGRAVLGRFSSRRALAASGANVCGALIRRGYVKRSLAGGGVYSYSITNAGRAVLETMVAGA